MSTILQGFFEVKLCLILLFNYKLILLYFYNNLNKISLCEVVILHQKFLNEQLFKGIRDTITLRKGYESRILLKHADLKKKLRIASFFNLSSISNPSPPTPRVNYTKLVAFSQKYQAL